MMLLWVYEFKLQKLCCIAAVFVCSFAGNFVFDCRFMPLFVLFFAGKILPLLLVAGIIFIELV
jgi:hypothetical protein